MPRRTEELFTCLDPDRKPVLLRRERAGGVGSERAGRIVGLVEIQKHLAVFGKLGVEKPARGIGSFGAGFIAKYEEEVVFFHHRIQPQRLSIEGEQNMTGTRHLAGSAQNVRNRDQLRLIIGDELGRYAIVLPYRKPMQARELLAEFTGDILEADSVAIASMDDKHR